MNKRLNNKGFSLVELIVVVAIIAVLTSIAAPNYLKYVEKSKRQKDIYNAKNVMEVMKYAHIDGSIRFNEDQGKSAVWVFVTKNGAQFYVNGESVFPTVNDISDARVVDEFRKILNVYGVNHENLKVNAGSAKDTGTAGTDEGWNWYCVYILSNGEVGAVSGPGNAPENYVGSWSTFNSRIIAWGDKEKSAMARSLK